MESVEPLKSVWVFVGEEAHLPAAVFSELSRAQKWVEEHKLTGIVTEYPVDEPLYEWAISHRHFVPKWPSQYSPRFIGAFTSAYLSHFHFEDGKQPGIEDYDNPGA